MSEKAARCVASFSKLDTWSDKSTSLDSGAEHGQGAIEFFSHFCISADQDTLDFEVVQVILGFFQALASHLEH